MKKLSPIIFAILFFSAAASAFAVNDVTIADITNFDLNTADTAVATTITASAGGLVTSLDVQANYIDITIDNLSTVTFNTTVLGNYLKVTKQSGSDDYTLAPACPTTTATITGTGAQVVLRLQVYTTDQCAVVPPPAGTGGTAGGYREGGQVLLGSVIATIPAPFTDIEGHWAQDYIDIVYTLGYIQGYEDNTFKPNQPISRAEASKLIALWFDKNITDSSCVEGLYADVPCTDWYGKYVGYLSDKGVLQGYGEGIFGPGRNITRAEALKIMLFAKALQSTNVGDVVNPFSDISAEDWYYSLVMIGYKLSIIQGYQDGTFGPNNSITRAEFTKIFVETLL